MGQIFSRPADFCRASTACSVIFDENGQISRVGGFGPGEFPGDPDVAGAGVCRPFIFLADFQVLRVVWFYQVVAAFFGLAILTDIVALFYVCAGLISYLWTRMRGQKPYAPF